MSISPEFWEGVSQFNRQEFYACHDTLEAIWMEAMEPEKTFYQGILQIAVALYHLGNHNQRGAMILLGEGIYRLSRYQPEYAEIDVTQLITQSAELLKTVQQMPPDHISDFVHQFFQGNQSTGNELDLSNAILPLQILKVT
jgi:uncharacterized protein